MSIYTDKNYDDFCESPRAKRKRLAEPGKHIMNKGEAKVMRRLKNDTGLSEEEIRAIKKYRVMLSEAQTVGTKTKRSKIQKVRDEVMKFVCRELKLPKEHPAIDKAYREEWKRRSESWNGSFYTRNTPYKNQGE
ncbi:hypothetical protein HN803_04500 [candidate division WWE3 bacterium]|jgi:hypothetical protein|nr:hypothetical protein [Candidatus Scalindua sp.]MBT7350024.1 hypothetical protein [candidate division WWE3 bacterium]